MRARTVKRIICVVAVAAPGALGLAYPASAEVRGAAPRATPRPLVGVNLHLFFRAPALGPGERQLTVAEAQRMVDRAAGAGADLVRVAVGWPLLEPRPGQLDADYLAFIDQVMSRVRLRRMRAVLVWGGVLCGYGALPPGTTERCETPDELRAGSRYYPESDFAVGLYAERAAWLVARHKRSIAAIEPVNEPNHAAFLRNAGGPAVAAKLTRLTFLAVKRVVPRVQVLLGALAGADAGYLESLYGAGVAGHFDAVSVHPYDVRFDAPAAGFGSPLAPAAAPRARFSFFSGIPAVRAVMLAHGDRPKKIWLTEFGYTVCPSSAAFCVSAGRQARWLSDAFRVAAGRADYVRAALAYVLQDYGGDLGGRMGLIAEGGEPRPALRRVSKLWKRLRGGALRAGEVTRDGRPLGLLALTRSRGMLRATYAASGSGAARVCVSSGPRRRCRRGRRVGVSIRAAGGARQQAGARAVGASVRVVLPALRN